MRHESAKAAKATRYEGWMGLFALANTMAALAAISADFDLEGPDTIPREFFPRWLR